MSAGRDLSIGIAGWGRAGGELHARALRGLAGARIAAVADCDARARARAAGVVGPERVFDDPRRLLEDPSLDAIALCMPVRGRAPIALEALAGGRPLFIEKPLALSLEESDRLVAAAARMGGCTMVGMNLRWHAQARRAKARIAAGGIGEVDLIRSTLTSWHDEVPEWRQRRSSGGGVLFEMAVHHVDLWRWLTGLEVVDVHAWTRSGTWDDESAVVNARLTGGALATAVLGERSVADNEIELFGRRGSVALSFYRFDGLRHRATGGVPGDFGARRAAAGEAIRGLAHLARARLDGGTWLETYRAEWRHFIDCVRRGVAPESTFADGAKALAVVLAAVDSARSGRPQAVAR